MRWAERGVGSGDTHARRVLPNLQIAGARRVVHRGPWLICIGVRKHEVNIIVFLLSHGGICRVSFNFFARHAVRVLAWWFRFEF